MGFFESLWQPGYATGSQALQALVRALLIAFIAGQLNAWSYKWTHRGVSYSRTYTQSLVLISLIGALSMFLVLSNPVAAFGLLGGMAIIRFRTVVRDAKDNVYLLLSLICGMAAGFGHAGVALIGAVSAGVIALYLHWTGFGSWIASDSLLRCQIASAGIEEAAIDPILRWFCYRFSVVSLDESPAPAPDGKKWYQCVYKVRLRDPATAPEFVAALEANSQTGTVHLLVDRENEEVV